MPVRSAVVLGGGLSGLSAALALAEAGWTVAVIERGAAVGGLAGSFEREGHCYPLGYHHILAKDRYLLQYLDRIGVGEFVRWRRVRMLFESGGSLYDLATPSGFMRFPMPLSAKLRFVSLMLRAFATGDWSRWEGRPARELLDAWGGPAVREALFEPLCRLKFELASEDVSAAWLGARLHYREGSSPLGYIPGTNWTKVLCDGMARLVSDAGVDVRVNTSVTQLETAHGGVTAAHLADGSKLDADIFISTVPPPVYLGLVPADRTPQLDSVRYTALLSTVCAAPAAALPPFYWLNLSSLRSTACAIFRLDALNPSIGRERETCINFVTHLNSRTDPRFTQSDDRLMAGYLEDFERLFGVALRPRWANVARVPMYSPIFDRAYRNPPVRSVTWPNVYFAGNYRTFPSVASTGTALASGLEAAAAILGDRGTRHATPADMPAAA